MQCSKMDLDADLDSYFLKDKDVGAKHLDSELDNYFKARDAAGKKVGVAHTCSSVSTGFTCAAGMEMVPSRHMIRHRWVLLSLLAS